MNISSHAIQARGALSSAASPVTSPLSGALRRLFAALQRFGQRRAARQLDFLGQQYRVSDPVLARQMHQAAADCRAAAIGVGPGGRS